MVRTSEAAMKGRFDTGSDIGNADVYGYSAYIAPERLDPGTYLLSIFNNTDANWHWASSSATDLAFKLTGNAYGQTVTGTGQVPEPATLLLLGAGLLGLVALGKKKRSRK